MQRHAEENASRVLNLRQIVAQKGLRFIIHKRIELRVSGAPGRSADRSVDRTGQDRTGQTDKVSIVRSLARSLVRSLGKISCKQLL